jgi:two-component system response regulator AtoC
MRSVQQDAAQPVQAGQKPCTTEREDAPIMDSKGIKAVIIEKNHAFRDYLRSVISIAGGVSYCFQIENTCLDNINALEPDLIIVGSLLPEKTVKVLNALNAIECALPVLIISGEKLLADYVENNSLESITIIDKHEQLDKYIKKIKKTSSKKLTVENRRKIPFIVGNTPEIIKIKKALPQLSRSNDPILIKGENGVGKETLARVIHLNSKDHTGLFIKIDASALSSQQTAWRLIDFFSQSNLNGKSEVSIQGNYVNGALYFDEICDIPNSLQAELLLFEKQNTDDCINPGLNGLSSFRIIAGTSKNIDMLVEKNEFRKDLYYRMNVFDLKIPALRERKEDISLLADFFTYRFCRIYKKSFFELSSKTKNAFLEYDWPDNVEELENAVKRAVMIRDERKFLSGFYLTARITNTTQRKPWIDSMASIDQLIERKDYVRKIDKMSLKDICWDCLANVEKSILKKALDNTNWNRKKAAGMLNISYKSMLNKIKEYGLA